MKERPILFSGPIVRAILEGRKTQTRRVIKRQPQDGKFPGPCHWSKTGWALWRGKGPKEHEGCTCRDQLTCPFGFPGDKLWVRETWIPTTDGKRVADYRATADGREYVGGWKPSIHMPKKFARIWLEVVSVRVERVQEITEEDAKAEGVEYQYPGESEATYKDYLLRTLNGCLTAKESFMTLWDSLNAKRGYGWDKNPWVWVVEFRLTKTSAAQDGQA